METVNVKMLKEGKRTIIIAEGADEMRDEVAYRILSVYYGLKQGIPPLPDEEDSPAPSAPGEAAASPSPARAPMPGLMEVKGLTPKAEEPVVAPSDDELSAMESYSSVRQRDHHTVPDGPYKGMTPISALMRDREKALVVFFYMTKGIEGKTGMKRNYDDMLMLEETGLSMDDLLAIADAY